MLKHVRIIFFIIAALVTALFWYKQSRPAYVPTPREEVAFTIIPGWDLRQVADHLVGAGFASTTADVFVVTGRPATTGNMEGRFAPETIRFFKDASVSDVVKAFTDIRVGQLKERESAFGEHDAVQILTMASIVEDEAKTEADRKMVADILWRRVKAGMALQVDSSVHYAIGKTGDVFTTGKERQVDSPWNTYLFPGLPPGPICNPSIESIDATIHPTANQYWYFLSGTDGRMHYARTLDEHTANRYKYLK